MLWLWAGDALTYTGKSAGGPGCTVEHFARINAVGDELPVRRFDVIDG